MELLQLKYFRELAHSEQLTQTARKLHITQPSLSQTLKRLEAELGMPLFDRAGKRIKLNTAGTIFLNYVDIVFNALENASSELDTLQQSACKTVTLQIQSASMLLPDLVKQIQTADPEIHLQIFQQTHNIPSDAPVLYLSSSPVWQNLEHEVLLITEPLIAALPKSHPLAVKSVLSLDDLKEASFISLSSTSNLTSTLQFYYEKNHFSPNITTYVDTPSIMRDLLRLNLGIAFVPELTWKGFASDTVILKQVKDLPMKRTLTLSWNPEQFQTPSAMLCREVIIDYFKKYSQQAQL